MTTLHLTLKKHWYDAIMSGDKKEEYRQITEHWIDRLTWQEYHNLSRQEIIKLVSEGRDVLKRNFDVIEFKNGYRKDSRVMTVELLDICIDKPKDNWCTGDKEMCFVLKLGRVFENKEACEKYYIQKIKETIK